MQKKIVLLLLTSALMLSTFIGGFPVENCKAEEDTTPPVLTSATVTPSTLTNGGEVTIQIEAEDDISGCDWLQYEWGGPNGHITGYCSWFDGTLTDTITISTNAPSGTYYVESIQMKDAADNGITYYNGTDYSAYVIVDNNIEADTEPPSKVTGLTVTDAKDGKLDISWNAASDNVDVSHYKIYRNGMFLTTVTISYQDTELTNSQSYSYQILAVDTSGNEGEKSDVVTGTPTATDTGGNGGNGGNGDGTTNILPVADTSAGEPYGYVDEEITFNGSLSYDPDGGDITSWYWDFGDGTNGTGEVTTHTYSNPGVYNVTLTVTDDENAIGSTETTAIISQANRPPATPTVNGTKTGNKNIEYTYTAVSTDPDNDTIRYIFDWGDGTNTTSAFLASGITYNTSHNWTTSGVYTVRVYAGDENNALSGTTEMTVFIDMNVQFIADVIQGYLLDTDNDGIYDIFHNNATGDETIVELQDNGNYLIDSDGDVLWDYEYDPETSTLSIYSPLEEEEKDIVLWYALVTLIVIASIVTIFVYLIRRKK